jgi:transposase-like protein/IS1 family transposase
MCAVRAYNNHRVKTDMDATLTTPAATSVGIACRSCGGRTIGWGKDLHGNPRRRCKSCKATFGIIPPRPLGSMRIDMEKAVQCLSMLTEGCSIRSTERLSGIHRDTIMRLLRRAGAKCEKLLNSLVRGVEVKDVQADELWCFVGMKEKTKVRKGKTDPELGDAYTWIALERESKVALSWHLGRRTAADASLFMAKLSAAAKGPKGKAGERLSYQLTTDGFSAYPEAIAQHLGGDVDYAMLVKTYSSETVDSERRYSPPRIISAEKIAISGSPDPAKVCTSHVERTNLHVRMQMRRFTRLTNAFSRKRENLKAALALHFAAYNFTWMHSSIRMTPAMKAGIARAPWTVRELLTV